MIFNYTPLPFLTHFSLWSKSQSKYKNKGVNHWSIDVNRHSGVTSLRIGKEKGMICANILSIA